MLYWYAHDVVNFLNSVTVYFQQIPTGFWQALIASGVLSPLIKVWKHFRITKKEKEIGEIAMFVIVTLVAFGVSLFQYLISKHPGSPNLILLHTAVVTFMTQPFYLAVVKPVYGYLTLKFGEAAKLEAELKSAVIPAGGLPLQQQQAALHASDTPAPDGF